ncbi:MAG: peptidylprolyl isomerase [Flammeovirgaceae bacterium]
MKIALIQTSKGKLEVELYEEDAPLTVAHFIELSKNGFYKNLKFFKHIPKVLVQTGCPFNNGLGDCGFHIKSELAGNDQFHEEGTLSFAHSGFNTASSQFFICLTGRNLHYLNGVHTVFGKVKRDSLAVLHDIKKEDYIIEIMIQENQIDPDGRSVNQDRPRIKLKDLPKHIFEQIKQNLIIKKVK